ncbi:MAG: TonB-dependent receptor [Ahrensia sp.]|nr:TonB-dependent receptor [Ahrensia sp.]
MKKLILLKSITSSALTSVALISLPAAAQDAGSAIEPSTNVTENEDRVDDIVVTGQTGSRIKRQSDESSPILSVGAEDLANSGAKDARDVIGNLAVNNGSQNNSDNLTQNFTVGTSNINLRGLGVASTLVLLNGRRQVLSSVATDDGSTFVDLSSLLPTLAIERVEILKDGASAIYGSDAVAGVANFITRSNFEGAEITAEYRTKTNDGSQVDFNLDGVIGGKLGEGGSFLIAASYLKRTSLLLGEVDFVRPALSGFGNPGSFVVPSLGLTVADPGCANFGGNVQSLANGSTVCRFDFGPQVTAVPEENRLQAYAKATWDWSDSVSLWAEAAYTRNDIVREVSPSFPVLNAPIVPANNPGNTFGEQVRFQGRPFGFGQSTEKNFYKHNTVRFGTGVEGNFGNGFSWDASYVYAANDSVQNPRDTITANFQQALLGFGGPNCDTSPTARTPAVAGQGGCLFFNPFSSANTAAPGSPLYNDPVLRNFFIGDYIAIAKSTLNVAEANLTGPLFTLPGGDAAFAIGAQFRKQGLSYAYDSISQQDGFGFLIGNRNFEGSSDVFSVYGEVLFPVANWLELSGAVRYESYGDGIGNTLDPKFSFLAKPLETLSLRGSYSTSFRAPSVFQTQGIQTNFVNIRDANGTTTFAASRSVGTDNLRPETSRAINVGATWQPINNVELSIDYYDFKFENALTKESAQAIVNANPNDTRIERTSAGTISVVNVAFINADSISTSGLDFSGRATFDTSIGTIAPFFDATLILKYDLTTNGRTIDGLGRLNRGTVGSSNQKFKGNLGVNWSIGSFNVNAIARYISSYEDDQAVPVPIDAFTTYDFNVSYNIGEFLRPGSATTLTLGFVNLTDKDPPFVAVSGSYDPRAADPRGRRAFVKLGTSF